MKPFALEEYQKHFGLTVEQDGMLSQRSHYGLTCALRNIIFRNPLLTRREINQRIFDILSPFSVDKEKIKKQIGEGLDLLMALQEVTELQRNAQQSVFSAVHPQWIQVDADNAILLGNFSDDELLFHPIDEYDTVRRFIINEKNLDILWRVPKTDFSNWLIQSCKSKICQGIKIDSIPELQNALQKLGNDKKEQLKNQPLESLNGDIAVVTGNNEDFFGSNRDTNNLTGRWRKLFLVDNGIYFGMMTGNRTDQTRWLLVEKYSDQMRCLSLHDKEQWRWLFLAKAQGGFYRCESKLLRLFIPIPKVLENWLPLFASQQPSWGHWCNISSEFSIIEYIFDTESRAKLPCKME